MSTINIRDVPEEITAAIDLAARAADARSRESFLRDFLWRSFGPEQSTAAAIAARVRIAVDHFETLGHFGVLKPQPTIAVISRALGHDDVGFLESELRGDRPLSFTDGDALCRLLGLDLRWLEGGGQSPPRFSTAAKHPDCNELLRDFVLCGISNDQLYFVLSDERGDAAIIGHTDSDDPSDGWRYDLLVDEIPIHNSVGGTGRAQREEFANLMVALWDDELFDEPVACFGRIVPQSQYDAMVAGYVHPATTINVHTNGAQQPIAQRSHWHEDFWSFERAEIYTKRYGEGREALLDGLRSRHIRDSEAYRAHVRKLVQSFKKTSRNVDKV